MKDNRFTFAIPCYNAEETITRMLLSIFMQTYDNYLILIRDDMSNDRTCLKISEICKFHNITCSVVEGNSISNKEAKVKVVKNIEKMWEVRNVLEMINDPDVRDNDIICRIDGDDFLCDLTLLDHINKVYDSVGCDVLWTAHIWSGTERVIKIHENVYDVMGVNISEPLMDYVDPYKHKWVSSHFKTFRKYLLNGVSQENYKDTNGKYYTRIGDQAFMLPALHNSKKRIFMPRPSYYYNVDVKKETFKTDDAKYQRDEAIRLREKGYVQS